MLQIHKYKNTHVAYTRQDNIPYQTPGHLILFSFSHMQASWMSYGWHTSLLQLFSSLYVPFTFRLIVMSLTVSQLPQTVLLMSPLIAVYLSPKFYTSIENIHWHQIFSPASPQTSQTALSPFDSPSHCSLPVYVFKKSVLYACMFDSKFDLRSSNTVTFPIVTRSLNWLARTCTVWSLSASPVSSGHSLSLPHWFSFSFWNIPFSSNMTFLDILILSLRRFVLIHTLD